MAGLVSAIHESDAAAMKGGWVYILPNKPNGILYAGVTNDLIRRIGEHRAGFVKGFTKRYGLTMLVYYEVHDSIEEAIKREKRMKEWNRNWKLRQIMEQNPEWKDLYETIAA